MATALAVLLFPGFAAAHGGDDPATTWNFMAIGGSMHERLLTSCSAPTA